MIYPVAHAQIKETILNAGGFKMDGLLQERPQFAQIFSRLMSLPFKFRGFSLPKILFRPKFTTISLSILFAFESTTDEFTKRVKFTANEEWLVLKNVNVVNFQCVICSEEVPYCDRSNESNACLICSYLIEAHCLWQVPPHMNVWCSFVTGLFLKFVVS